MCAAIVTVSLMQQFRSTAPDTEWLLDTLPALPDPDLPPELVQVSNILP